MSTGTMIEDPEQMMLIGCGHVVVSEHGRVWECVLELCDGEHHWMQISPWEYH